MGETVETMLKYARQELKVLAEQGCDVWELERQIELIEQEAGPARSRKLEQLCDRLAGVERSADFPYEEPSDLEQIREQRPEGPRRIAVSPAAAALQDRTLGAWFGRAAGCMLGKPVEGWPAERIADLMEVCGLDDLTDYIPEPPQNDRGISFDEGRRPVLRGNIRRAERDDDTDYTIIGLNVLERHGREFTPRQVAEFWLGHLPYRRTYTAERVAYRNFVNGIWPPDSARHRNPYREWIGAQIRADAFGYACPGAPEQAAGLAFKDACISHTRNGIYGEMWVAAMLAAAFVSDDAETVIRIGLSEVPANCRLSDAIEHLLSWRAEGCSAEEARDRVMERYGSYHRVHTINNAALVARALLWGEGDFSRTIALAVRGGLDTDCNGATAGSVAGAMLGAAAIPAHWTDPFGDRIETAVCGQSGLTISGLAQRTRQIQQSAQERPGRSGGPQT